MRNCHWLALLFSFIANLSVPTASAAILSVRVMTSFQNENWFPLSEKDMREAAIDTALDKISSYGFIAFADEGEGTLNLKVTLVEPAQVAKLTIQLTTDGMPSALSTASTSLENLDFNGIYYAFEHIGQEAASRLNAKLISIEKTLSKREQHEREREREEQRQKRVKEQQLTKKISLVALEGSHSTPPVVSLSPILASSGINCPTNPLAKLTIGEQLTWSMRLIYMQGQQLKERRCYFDAMVAFELVVANRSKENASWRQLAQEELSFGLPIFEARQLSLEISSLIRDSSNGWGELSAFLNRIELLYRQILVENELDVERVMTAQRELDQYHHIRKALRESTLFNAMADASMLQQEIRMSIALNNGLPQSREQVESRHGRYLADFELLDYQVDRRLHEARLQLRHKRWETKLEIYIDPNYEIHLNVLN